MKASLFSSFILHLLIFTMICDYEGSDYKARFWQNADRAYEDAVERVAIAKFLPPTGKRIIEIGAGFGRLGEMYRGYDEIILLDYSRSLLDQAREMWGHDPRFKFVAASVYELPFVPGVINTALMIRVMHHMADVPAALHQIRQMMAANGTFILEFANKRNLKAMARYALGKQAWSPYTPEPVEFVKLNYDFHPQWMGEQLKQAGFVTQQCIPVSYLRAGVLKRTLPLNMMVGVDKTLQGFAPLLAPSVFSRNQIPGGPDASALTGEAIFCSPKSGAPLRRDGDMLICDADGTRWRVDGNFYDFKEVV